MKTANSEGNDMKTLTKMWHAPRLPPNLAILVIFTLSAASWTLAGSPFYAIYVLFF
jgi:hypothetical protein